MYETEIFDCEAMVQFRSDFESGLILNYSVCVFVFVLGWGVAMLIIEDIFTAPSL